MNPYLLNTDNWIMSLTDYKEYFKKDTILTDNETIINLLVSIIPDPCDNPWEYSIVWSNEEANEGGEIRHINTSSRFSLMISSWKD